MLLLALKSSHFDKIWEDLLIKADEFVINQCFHVGKHQSALMKPVVQHILMQYWEICIIGTILKSLTLFLVKLSADSSLSPSVLENASRDVGEIVKW